MNFIKKYKNLIVLVAIIVIILSGNVIFHYGKSIAKSIEKYFTTTKTDYSKLNNQSFKIKKSYKNSSKKQNNSSTFSKNKPSAEELDKKIMSQNTPSKQKKQIDPEESAKRKLAEEKFDLEFKELDKF